MEENNELINNSAVEYTDDNIRHLSDMEHVRTRPGMYMERIHRAMADARLLANPASWGRVADPSPN